MGGDLYLRRSPAVRRPGATALHDRTRASGPALLDIDFSSCNGKTAKPGLYMTLNTSDEPGHTAWVDKNGAFGVPLKLDSGTAPDVSVAIILSPRALSPDKALSLRSARHEMVHARHKTKVLEAVKAWQSSPDAGSRLR